MDATLIAPTLVTGAVLYLHVLFWFDKRRESARQAEVQRLIDQVHTLRRYYEDSAAEVAASQKLLRRCMLDVAKYSRWSK